MNILNTCQYCKFAINNHCIPIAPHLYFPQFMDDNIPNKRNLAFQMNSILMNKCNELWVFGKYISSGMQKEINMAKKKKCVYDLLNQYKTGVLLS